MRLEYTRREAMYSPDSFCEWADATVNGTDSDVRCVVFDEAVWVCECHGLFGLSAAPRGWSEREKGAYMSSDVTLCSWWWPLGS